MQMTIKANFLEFCYYAPFTSVKTLHVLPFAHRSSCIERHFLYNTMANTRLANTANFPIGTSKGYYYQFHTRVQSVRSIFQKFFQISPICFAFCQLCFDFWIKTADSGCLCSATLQKLPDVFFEKNHDKVAKSKTNWRHLKKLLENATK